MELQPQSDESPNDLHWDIPPCTCLYRTVEGSHIGEVDLRRTTGTLIWSETRTAFVRHPLPRSSDPHPSPPWVVYLTPHKLSDVPAPPASEKAVRTLRIDVGNMMDITKVGKMP